MLTGQRYHKRSLGVHATMLRAMRRTSNDIETLGQQEWLSSDARGYNASARLHRISEECLSGIRSRLLMRAANSS